MLERFVCLVGFYLSVAAALAEVCVFPSDASSWRHVTTESGGNRLVVKDARGKTLLAFDTEGGAFADKLVVTGAVDHLVIDARAAFQAGMGKLVFNSPDFDPKPYEGREITLVSTFGGVRGTQLRSYFEGHGAHGHFYTSRDFETKGHVKTYPMVKTVRTDLRSLHLRWDLVRANGPVAFYGARYAPFKELPVKTGKTRVKPELLFHASFDGTAEATTAKGTSHPSRTQGLAYAPGVRGQAVRLTQAANSVLAYPAKGNLENERGTVSLWFKREWPDAGVNDRGGEIWRALFANPDPKGTRAGSGQLWFWWWGARLRADLSDDDDSYRIWHSEVPHAWNHLAITWDEEGARIFLNGRPEGEIGDSVSPMCTALNPKELLSYARESFDTFFVGCKGASQRFDGLIDELCIYSAPLSADQVSALFRRERVQKPQPPPDYTFKRGNPYELPPARDLPPGCPANLKLVDTLTFDREPSADRFRKVGPVQVKALDGVRYLEAGPKPGDRFAVRFKLPEKAPLWCFEIDYPDDAVRTADLIVQTSKRPQNDYALQVGYATGDEYPNTGKTLTHRCLYWAASDDVTLVAMTAREKAPAAISAIRVYRVEGDALPAVDIREPVFPRGGTVGPRMVGLYFEDPAIGYDFGLAKSNGYERDELEALIDRTAALMKFTGENLFCYPGAWYHGLIGERYNPRRHAPDFLRAWYAKFDLEGLSLMPTVNPNTMPFEEGVVTLASMKDGSLHPTAIAIHDTGKPNWGGWHDTPPNFNFHHPDVQANIRGILKALAEQGAPHPSFKGICLHVTRHNMLTFGDEISGYNDYTVDAFAKAKGLAIPVDRTDPLRGKAYAAWLRANAWEEWIQWRCDQVTAFYVAEARKLAARRKDLKLWINWMVPADVQHPDFRKPDFMTMAWRGAGLDAERLAREAPNVILGQTMVPADYRWRGAASYPSPAARAHQRVLDQQPGFYANLKTAVVPFVHQHDRYWESPIGAGKGPAQSLFCDWLDECGWRVSTINPGGVNALRHFVEPLRFQDVLGVTKGGFLIGTYGMERELASFARAFRALPGVRFDEAGGTETVKVRQKTWNGRSYFYVVNTDLHADVLTLDLPAGTTDLVTGERLAGRTALKLAPYELRSFAAPAGKPVVKAAR